MTRVGFVGLGSQGAPMARRIVEAGFGLTIWARRPESVEPFGDTSAAVAATPKELGEASDVVAVCVVDDSGVEEVLLGREGVLAGMSPGGVVAIHSTVHPDTCVRLGDVASSLGVVVVDAPVSGGGGAAAAGNLLVMVGGEAEAVERCRPIFATFGAPVIHLGPLGSGQTAKLINNLIFTAQITLAMEGYSFADELGVDRAALAQVLASGSGASRAAAILAASGFDTSGLRIHGLPLLKKDNELVLAVARAKNASLPAHIAEMAKHTLVALSTMSDHRSGGARP